MSNVIRHPLNGHVFKDRGPKGENLNWLRRNKINDNQSDEDSFQEESFQEKKNSQLLPMKFEFYFTNEDYFSLLHVPNATVWEK